MKDNNRHSAVLDRPETFKSKPSGTTNRRQVKVELACEAPQASQVSVAGDFNQWRASDLCLRKDPAGVWRIQLWLTPGRHEYRFIVDGEWQNDPHAPACTANDFGSTNSVLQVG